MSDTAYREPIPAPLAEARAMPTNGAAAAEAAELNARFAVAYDELRRLAGHYLRREAVGHTLQPTALVHEAYIRLAQHRLPVNDRAQFFGAAARTMRRILVNHARDRRAAKRGGGGTPAPLDAACHVAAEPPDDGALLAVDAALSRLACLDPRQAHVVELRYFAGLSIEETAEVLGISPATVKREWTTARVWLQHAVSRT